MSRNLELAQLAKTLTVNANGTVTGLNIDASNIDGIPNTDLNIAPEVLEIQVAAPAAGQDTAWLWTWEQSTLPYARRTITNSPEVQVPIYKQGTYTVNNFAAYTTHANMSQTHSLYFKWIDGAGTDNLVSWATSTGPISDTHPSINSGNATDVQRISLAVPATVTPPALTTPSVSYTVANNSAGAYTFSGSADGDNPNLGPFYKGGTYTINISATGHPFYFTTDNGTNFSAGTYFGEYTTGVTGSRTDSGTITFTVPSNAPDTLYYQCGNHSAMRGSITVKDLAVETNINGNYVIYAQHTQEGHKTPVEIRPIPSLVNQMCLVYDASSSAFVPQDLATYVENTPSFENKIREVAGTAELVVEDGSAVIAKVNVYDDSTYLPLTGNNSGDQAFATDLNILYIWDGSAWQQAGTTNSDDLTEGSTNLFFTDARADARAQLKVDALVDAAPGTLDTLNELAAALGDDANFSTTVTNSIATKLATADFTSTADTWLGTKSTSDVAEGTNLYYTDARADARADARIAAATTSDLTEGTNLYYTSARVQAESFGGSLTGTVSNATVQYGTSYSGTPAQGSFFFDSLNQKLKIYTGSAFVDAVPAGGGGGGGGGSSNANATFEKYTYSITSSTNAVSGADDNSETLSYATGGNQNVEVYVNGVKQVEGSTNDYVATTGTSVTFVDNLASGDVVDIQVYELLTNDAFYLKADTYTKTETNSQISTAVAGIVDSAPTTLDTLNELAAALGDDANFSTTVTNSIATKLPLAGGTLTGNLGIGVSASSAIGVYHSQSLANGLAAELTNTQSSTGSGIVVKGGNNSSTYSADFRDYNNTTLMRIRGDGNVGIGTTSPGSKLSVSGPAALANLGGGSTASSALYINSTSGHVGELIQVLKNGAIKMHMANNGNLGIGTASPSRQLHVNGGNEANLHLTSDSGRSGIFVDKPGTSSIMGSVLVLQSDSSYRLGTASNYHVQMFQDGVTQIMGAGALGVSVDTSANVGVGTSSPNNVSGYRTLHVDGTSGSLIDLGTSGKESRIVADDNGLGFQVTPGTHTNQNIRWKAGQISGVVDSHMLLNSSGHLGIGETNPNSLLHINGGRLHHNDTTNSSHYGAASTVYPITDVSIIGGKLRFSIAVFFGNGISNLAVRIYAAQSSLWFAGEVCIGSTYSSQQATGLNRYSFSHNSNTTNNYGNILTQTESFGQVPAQFQFASHGYDTTENAHYFEFRHTVSTGNTMFLQFEGVGSTPDHANMATWYYKHTTF